MKPLLLLRADATSACGTGHVMRCLALAQAWRDAGGEAVFVGVVESPALVARLRQEGMGFVPLPRPSLLAQDFLPLLAGFEARVSSPARAWMALDGYFFTPECHAAIRAARWKLLVFDDMNHLREYHADVLLNQNVGAKELAYAAPPETTRLLGPRYALLRREFLAAGRERKPAGEAVRRVLITMGGSDPDNASLCAVRAVKDAFPDGVETTVLLGALYRHEESLRRALAGWPGKADLPRFVEDMPAVMAWSDVAIAAAGSTCWELLYMGVPPLLLVLADNQENVARALAARKAAISVGRRDRCTVDRLREALSSLRDKGTREELARRGREFVDGAGADRVVSFLLSGAK